MKPLIQNISRTILLPLVCLTIIANAQKDTLRLQQNYNCLVLDELNNIYVWNNENLKKITAGNGQNYVYNNIALGVISRIDAGNPLKILVFHADFNAVVTVDNTLTPNGSTIDLTDYNLENTSLICRSYNNGMWCYDPVLFKLIRFDNAMQITNEVEYVQNIISDYDSIFFMTEKNEQLYLQSPKKIFVFDKFGSYLKSIPVASKYKAAIFEKGVFYVKNNRLYYYSFSDIDAYPLEVNVPDNLIDFDITDNKVYWLMQHQIEIERLLNK